MERSQYEIEKNFLVDENTGELLEILVDESATGKRRPWAKHKMENMTVSECYYDLSNEILNEKDYWYKKYERLQGCGNRLIFNIYSKEEKRKMKVKHAESCRVRLCPLCSWRRSIKIYTHSRKIIEQMQAENKYCYLFLTLTVPNVSAEKLNVTIDDVFKAWNRLAGYKRFENSVKGWYRGLEITHNINPESKSYDTYHPHFHCIIAVDKNYFKKSDYINRDEWLKMWQKATKNNNITQVDVRKIKPKNDNETNDIIGAICEVTKYTVKNSDYIIPKNWQLTKDTVKILDNVLANRRLVAFGGAMKEWHKKLNLDDEIDGELIEDGEEINGQPIEEVTYCWNVGYQQYIKL